MTRMRLTLGLVLVVAACGRDAAGPTGPTTPARARDLAGTLVGLSTAPATSSTPQLSLGPARSASTPFTLHYHAALPCPAGGTFTADVTLTGNFDRAAQTAFVDLTGKETAASCASTADGQKVTVSGSLDLTGHAEISGAQPAGVQTFTLKGSFDWTAADGSHGTCTLDLASSADLPGKTGTVKGTLCGTDVNYSGKLK